jgi:short-subunit dehydrogenase
VSHHRLRVGVFGATATLAQSAIRIWAGQGAALVLAARNEGRLAPVVADARIRGAAAVQPLVAEFSDGAQMAAVAATAWEVHDGLDVALLAWGSLSDQPQAQSDVRYLAAELDANFVAFACLAQALASRMRVRRAGTLCLVGSVAGDRARPSHYAYAAAKAGVAAFSSGLRAACRGDGVHVLTVKPGPFASPMTSHLRPRSFWSTPDAAAGAIVRGIAAGKETLYVPAYWRPIMFAVRMLPEAIAIRLRC